MQKLIVEKGEASEPIYRLTDGEHLVGRSRAASIRLTADDISSRHLVLRVNGERVEAENLSRFGTVVNDQPLLSPTQLRPGQRIHVGRGTVLRLEEMSHAELSSDEATGIPKPALLPVGDESRLLTQARTLGSRSSELTRSSVPAPSASSEPTLPPVKSAPSPLDGAVTGKPSGDLFNDQAKGEKYSAKLSGPVPVGHDSNADVTGAHSDFDQITSQGEAGQDISSGGVEGGTHAMMTRPAGVEEIEYLRLREQGKTRRRIYIITGLGLLVLSVLFLLRPKPESPVLTWDDSYEEGLAPAPLGEVNVKYPKSKGCKVETTSGGVKILCPLGHRQAVSLRLIYQEEISDQWVARDSVTAIREWERTVSGGEGQWTFDKANPSFMGPDNGVQYWAIPYQRQKDGIWRGMASLIRHGRRLMVMRVEIPFSDQARVEEFLYYTYLDLPLNFTKSHWEGRVPLPSGEVRDILQHCKMEVSRDAPATWAAVERDLIGAITKAVVEKKTSEEKDSIELLVKLRGKMTKWFNEKRLMFIAASAQSDKKKIQELVRACQAVFLNTDDRRYYEARRWSAEF